MTRIGERFLSRWRYHLTENVRGTMHMDYRTRKGFAQGLDLEYKTPHTGSGIFKTYFPQEHATDSKFFFSQPTEPAVIRERYKGEWRHRWDINPQTNMLVQYYKLSDRDFLKDYFRREFDKDANPPTYFFLTHGFPVGSLSLRVEPRVNSVYRQLSRGYRN